MVRLLLLLAAGPALAGDAVIERVEATVSGGLWRFHVKISHDDTGWDHYADGWSVLLPDGTVLGHRKLLHPHVEEQPFTRALSGVEIPAGIREVLVRPHDSVHGEGEAVRIALPGRKTGGTGRPGR